MISNSQHSGNTPDSRNVGSPEHSPNQGISTGIVTTQNKRYEQPSKQTDTQPPHKKQSFLKTLITSSTTYSSAGGVVFASVFITTDTFLGGVLTFLPVVAHFGLGALALINEQRKINNVSNSKTTTSQNFIMKIFGYVSKEINNPSIYRTYKASILWYQAGISLLSLRLFDATIFTVGALGNIMAGKDTNEAVDKNKPQTEAVAQATQATLLSRFSVLAGNTGIYWMIWGGMAGLRDISVANLVSPIATGNLSSLSLLNHLMPGIAVVAGFGIAIAYGIRALNSLFSKQETNIKREKVLTLKCSAFQLFSLAVANFCIGNPVIGSAFILFAASSYSLSAQIFKKLATTGLGLLMCSAASRHELVATKEVNLLSNKPTPAFVCNVSLTEFNFPKTIRPSLAA